MMTEIRSILVPVDFSENSRKILQDAENFAKKLGAKISVIFVVQSFEDYSGFFVPHMPISKFEEEMIDSAESKMEAFVRDAVSESILDQTKVTVGDIGEEITGYAASAQVDMIVMGTHGYKGLERILFGSVAEQVVKTAPCPVLTINPYK